MKFYIQALLSLVLVGSINTHSADIALEARIRACLAGTVPTAAAAARPATTTATGAAAAAKPVTKTLNPEEKELFDTIKRRYKNAMDTLSEFENVTPDKRNHELEYQIGRVFSNIFFAPNQEELDEVNKAIAIFSGLPKSDENKEILSTLEEIRKNKMALEEKPALHEASLTELTEPFEEELAGSMETKSPEELLKSEYQTLSAEKLNKEQLDTTMIRYVEYLASKYANQKDVEIFLQDEINRFIDLPVSAENEAILHALTEVNSKIHAGATPTMLEQMQRVLHGADYERHRNLMDEK